MASKILERLERELSTWRTRIEEMRVQASLAKLEARDKKEELGRDFEKAFNGAKHELDELRRTGEKGLGDVINSLEAGWEQARKTYKEASQKKG